MSENGHGAEGSWCGAARSGIAEEAKEMAERLQELARMASDAAQHRSSEGSAVGVMTDITGDELASWEGAEASIAEATADIEHLKGRVAVAQAWRQSALERHDQLAEEHRHTESELRRRAEAAEQLVEPRVTRGEEVQLRKRLAEFEAEVEETRREEQAHEQETEEEARELRLEIEEMEASTRASQAEVKRLESDPSTHRKAEEVAEAIGRMEQAETELCTYEQQRTQLKEEVSELRVSVRGLKTFQQKRTQELTTKLHKLEKQRRKLENDAAAKSRSEEAARVAESESQLSHLRRLNEQLIAQVEEAERESAARKAAMASLHVERVELIEQCEEHSAQVVASEDVLDELSSAQYAAKREGWRQQSRIALLARQGRVLEQTAEQTTLQLEEAEAMKAREMKEEQEAEKNLEFYKWRLNIATQQLASIKHPA